jgi:hypothetical protein
MDKETFFQEYKGVIVAIFLVIVLGIVLLLSFVLSSKSVTIVPVRGQSMTDFKAGQPYVIGWKASNISRVGIVLFNGDKPQWVAQNIPASAGNYTWNSYAYQDSGTNYRFAVFEYPWRKGGAIAYSPSTIQIMGPKYASCYDYSVEQGWVFLPSSYPKIHRVFITPSTYSANMGGISGADEICKNEAAKAGYTGNFIAFLGTDSVSATERITKDGIFVEAEPIGTLAEGVTCNRYLAQSAQQLLDRTRLIKNLAQVQLSDTFYRRLGDIWYGRRTASTEKKCLQINMQGVVGAFSGTYTCQDWSVNKRQIYYGSIPAEADLTRCYDSEGKNLQANYYGATAGSIDEKGALINIGETCDASHRVMCVEQ